MSSAQIWFLVGLFLVLAEFVLPGVILVFIGLGAWLASLATWLGWTSSLGSQMVVFAISSLVLLLGLRRLFKSWLMGFSRSNPDAARNLDDFIGKPVRVMTAFESGVPGKVEFKGANWTAESEEAFQPGDTAVIAAVEGLCLKVRRR